MMKGENKKELKVKKPVSDDRLLLCSAGLYVKTSNESFLVKLLCCLFVNELLLN